MYFCLSTSAFSFCGEYFQQNCVYSRSGLVCTFTRGKTILRGLKKLCSVTTSEPHGLSLTSALHWSVCSASLLRCVGSPQCRQLVYIASVASPVCPRSPWLPEEWFILPTPPCLFVCHALFARAKLQATRPHALSSLTESVCNACFVS